MGIAPSEDKMSPRLTWPVAMAVRDGRKSWKRLLLYVSATSIGIAALVAAGSFRRNLQEAIRQQAKPLLGADLIVDSRKAFGPETNPILSSLPFQKIRETRLTTVGV